MIQLTVIPTSHYLVFRRHFKAIILSNLRYWWICLLFCIWKRQVCIQGVLAWPISHHLMWRFRAMSFQRIQLTKHFMVALLCDHYEIGENKFLFDCRKCFLLHTFSFLKGFLCLFCHEKLLVNHFPFIKHVLHPIGKPELVLRNSNPLFLVSKKYLIYLLLFIFLFD